MFCLNTICQCSARTHALRRAGESTGLVPLELELWRSSCALVLTGHLPSPTIVLKQVSHVASEPLTRHPSASASQVGRQINTTSSLEKYFYTWFLGNTSSIKRFYCFVCFCFSEALSQNVALARTWYMQTTLTSNLQSPTATASPVRGLKACLSKFSRGSYKYLWFDFFNKSIVHCHVMWRILCIREH